MENKTTSFEEEPFPNNDVEKIRQLLYWQFQYVRRNFLQNYDEFYITEILSNLQQWQDPELKDHTLRYVSNAISHKQILGDCIYELSRVPQELLGSYQYFVTLSQECGYYLNDILYPYPVFKLIEFINENNTTPLPPVPFLGGRRNSSQQIAMYNLTLYMHGTSYKPISEKDDSDLKKRATKAFKENVNAELKASLHSDEAMDTATARIFDENWNRVISGEVEITKKKMEQLIKIFNKYDKSLYRMKPTVADRAKSLEKRAVGLYLWDYVNIHGLKLEDAIDILIKDCSFSKSIENIETQDFKRSLNGANQCIKECTVLKADKK